MAADVAEVVWYQEDATGPTTVTKPAGFAAGQILIAIHVQHGGALADLTAPSGWAEEENPFSSPGDPCFGKVFSHPFNAGDPATWDFPCGAGTDICLGLFRITGADTTPVVVVTSTAFDNITSSTDSPTVTPSGSDDLLICTLAEQGSGTALSETDPSGMTDRSQTQVTGNFMALAGASQQLASSSPTGVRTWTSITPVNQDGGTFSIAIKSAAGADAATDDVLPTIPPPLLFELLAARQQLLDSDVPPEPLTDPWQAPFPTQLLLQLAAWQLRLYGGEEIVAGAGTPQTGADGLGFSGFGTAVRVAAVTGSTSLGLSGAGTARKTAVETGGVTVGLSGTGTEKKTAPELGRAAIGLAGTGVEKKTAPDTGLAAVGFSGRGTAEQNIPRPETGTVTFGLSGRGTEVKRAAQTGVASLGLSGRGTERKTAPEVGRSVLGLAGSGTERKTAPDTGRAAIGLSGRGTATVVTVVVQTGRAYLGLSGVGIANTGGNLPGAGSDLITATAVSGLTTTGPAIGETATSSGRLTTLTDADGLITSTRG